MLFFLRRCVFWKRYQNMISDKLKHFVVMIKLSSNYFFTCISRNCRGRDSRGVSKEKKMKKQEEVTRLGTLKNILPAHKCNSHHIGRQELKKKTYVGMPDTYMSQTVTQIFNDVVTPLSILQWRHKVQGFRSVVIKIKQPLQPYC